MRKKRRRNEENEGKREEKSRGISEENKADESMKLGEKMRGKRDGKGGEGKNEREGIVRT